MAIYNGKHESYTRRISVEDNRDYYNSDYFKHWIGIRGKGETAEGRAVNKAIADMFQDVNLIEECVNHYADALFGKSPVISISGKGKEDAEVIDQIGQEVTSYCNDFWQFSRRIITENGHNTFYQAQVDVMIDGDAYLRVCRVGDRIIVHCPPQESVIIKGRNILNQPTVIHYVFTEIVDDKPVEYIEVHSFLDDGTGRTLITYTDKNGEAVDKESIILDLDGHLAIQELRRRPFITTTMKSAQNALSHAATMIPRNNDLSNFSKTYVNAKPPGKWVTDGQSGERDFELNTDALAVSPGIVNFVGGMPLKDTGGLIKGYTQPTIHVDQPIDVTSFITSANFFIAIIYTAASLGHLIAKDLILSGRSRAEMRNDFIVSLQKDAERLADCYASVFTIALLMNKAMLGEPLELYKKITIQVKVTINPGKPTPEERDEIIKLVQAGLMSRQTAIAQLGYVDDELAEIAKIESEKQQNSSLEE